MGLLFFLFYLYNTVDIEQKANPLTFIMGLEHKLPGATAVGRDAEQAPSTGLVRRVQEQSPSVEGLAESKEVNAEEAEALEPEERAKMQEIEALWREENLLAQRSWALARLEEGGQEVLNEIGVARFLDVAEELAQSMQKDAEAQKARGKKFFEKKARELNSISLLDILFEVEPDKNKRLALYDKMEARAKSREAEDFDRRALQLAELAMQGLRRSEERPITVLAPLDDVRRRAQMPVTELAQRLVDGDKEYFLHVLDQEGVNGDLARANEVLMNERQSKYRERAEKAIKLAETLEARQRKIEQDIQAKLADTMNPALEKLQGSLAGAEGNPALKKMAESMVATFESEFAELRQKSDKEIETKTKPLIDAAAQLRRFAEQAATA